MTVGRREFLETLAATAGSLCFGARSAFRARAPSALRIGLVATEHDRLPSAVRGAMLGAAEAGRVATLLGRELSLVRSTDPERLVADGVEVLVGGLDDASCATLSELAERHDRVFLNVACTSDVFRGRRCRRSTFHVAASDAMRHDAAGAVGSSGDVSAIQLWHPGLERYGAAQLNDRFRAEYGAAMDSTAWSAWLAVKIAWEAAARLSNFDASRAIAWLENPRTRFDGHKGRALSFRPWDHQLRQPVYHVTSEPEASIVEIPPPERDSAIAVTEQLDRIGTTAEHSACRWEAP